jgi:hypothetical protein
MKTLHLQLPISIIKNLGLGITPIVTTETADILAVCQFVGLAEHTKLIVSISTIGTILITASHDVECECDATIVTEWFTRVKIKNVTFSLRPKVPTTVSDYYTEMITQALNSNPSKNITIDPDSIRAIIDNVEQLIKSVTIE